MRSVFSRSSGGRGLRGTLTEESRQVVLVVASTYPVPGVAGVPRFVETLSSALSSHLDVHVVALARGVESRGSVSSESGIQVTRVGRRGGVPGSGVLSSLRVRSLLPELWLITRWLFKVALLARRTKPTVIHVHWAFPVPPLLRLLRALRIVDNKFQYFVTLHGADVLLLDGKLRRLMKFGLRGAEGITTVNEQYRRVVGEAVSDRAVEVVVIPMPVDARFYGVSRRSGFVDGSFLFVGRLIPKKGVEELVRAVSYSTPLSERGLRLIGSGELFELRRLSSTSVDFLGPAQADGVLQAMCEARALICPFVNPEGLPVTVLEACATGVPVISSRVSGVQALEQFGFVVWPISDPVCPESIADAVARFELDLAEEPGRVAMIVQQNRERALRFTPTHVAGEFLSLFDVGASN